MCFSQKDCGLANWKCDYLKSCVFLSFREWSKSFSRRVLFWLCVYVCMCVLVCASSYGKDQHDNERLCLSWVSKYWLTPIKCCSVCGGMYMLQCSVCVYVCVVSGIRVCSERGADSPCSTGGWWNLTSEEKTKAQARCSHTIHLHLLNIHALKSWMLHRQQNTDTRDQQCFCLFDRLWAKIQLKKGKNLNWNTRLRRGFSGLAGSGIDKLKEKSWRLL